MEKRESTTLSFEERAKYFVKDMTIDERINQLVYLLSAAPDFNIDKYFYDACKDGLSQFYPQLIKMASTFNIEVNKKYFIKALEQGLISEENIDSLIYKLAIAKMEQGIFNKDELVYCSSISDDNNVSTEYEEIDKQITAESIVLLKNNRLLPLSREKINKIAVICFMGNNEDSLTGNYSQIPSMYSTVVNGFKRAHPKAQIMYPEDCDFKGKLSEDKLQKVLSIAEEADIAVLAFSLNQELKFNKGEALPKVQTELIEKICAKDKPTIFLNLTELSLYLTKADELCDAVFQCWYTSELSLDVTAGMIFNDYQPSGKLPLTFYKNTSQNSSVSETVVYPFGYGLSYSFIEYYRVYLSSARIKAGQDITVTIFLKNKGKSETKDVVQAYLRDEEASVKVPEYKLVSFRKVLLSVEKEIKVSITIKAKDMALIGSDGKMIIEPGRFSLYVGGGQPDDVTAELYNRDCLHIGYLVE